MTSLTCPRRTSFCLPGGGRIACTAGPLRQGKRTPARTTVKSSVRVTIPGNV